MSYSYQTTMYESSFAQMYVFLAAKYYLQFFHKNIFMVCDLTSSVIRNCCMDSNTPFWYRYFWYRYFFYTSQNFCNRRTLKQQNSKLVQCRSRRTSTQQNVPSNVVILMSYNCVKRVKYVKCIFEITLLQYQGKFWLRNFMRENRLFSQN